MIKGNRVIYYCNGFMSMDISSKLSFMGYSKAMEEKIDTRCSEKLSSFYPYDVFHQMQGGFNFFCAEG